MATISKFYLHDALTANTGTMPGTADQLIAAPTGDATNARLARVADDVIGAGQTSAAFSSTANQNPQAWGYRRFVSAPLAAHTFANTDGTWTFSYARAESSLLHNQSVNCRVFFWRPSTGLMISGPTQHVVFLGAEPTVAGAQQAESLNGTYNTAPVTIINGDIMVIEIIDNFSQSHSSSYTSTFYYDGTTEASTTNCASFVTSPVALTLFSGNPRNPAINFIDPAVV